MLARLVVFASILLSGIACGQIPVPPAGPGRGPVFDVVTIKPAPAAAWSGGFRRMDPGVFVISSMTIRELVQNAYGLRSAYQLVGASREMDGKRYDISAKSTNAQVVDPHGLSDAQWTAAHAANYEKLRSLLADRFQLKAHIETRQLPVYALVSTGKLKLHAAPCADTYYLQAGLAKGQIRITSLIAALSRDLNRPIKDATGLTGCYDIDMKWTQDPDQDQDNVDLPSIDTALQNVGLRFESRKSAEEVLVVDHVQPPSED